MKCSYNGIKEQSGKPTDPKTLNQRLMDSRVPKSELEWFAKRRIEKLQRVTMAARKLVQCFPDEIEGEEQSFDIPRYVIDELEIALEEAK